MGGGVRKEIEGGWGGEVRVREEVMEGGWGGGRGGASERGDRGWVGRGG